MRRLVVTFVGFLSIALFAQTDEQPVGPPPEVANDAGVVRSILDKNNLASVPLDEVATFAAGRIVKLNLDNPEFGKQGLTILPPEIGKLSELTELTVNDNDLVILPDEIGDLKQLRKLEVRNNSLVSLPSTIGNLGNLAELDVRNNELTSLPLEIGLLGRLWKLQLWGNSIRELPQSIGALSSLRELYLRNNRITTFPMSVLKLKLSYIDVQENRICSPGGAIDMWLKKFDPKYHSWQKCW